MAKFLIVSDSIHTPAGKINGGLVINGSKIYNILTEEELFWHADLATVDARGCMVLPGLVDTHIHGAAGWDVAAGSEEQIKGLCRYLPSVGVTAFKPTLGGENVNQIKTSLKKIAAVMEQDYEGARILGIHLEGPFLNPKRKGAFIVENLLEPSVPLMQEFIEASGGRINHITVSPELGGAEELITVLKEEGILVAGGHTEATNAETNKGIEWGISLSTHTTNAQRSIHHREPGALGAYLLAENVYCELICDFFHVHPDMIRLIIKLKGPDKISMVSDTVIGAQLNPGQYDFSEQKIIIDEEGWSRLPDGTISGSTKSLLFGVKNMLGLGYSLEDVMKMASFVPAKLSKVEGRKGSLEQGKDADLIILDKDFGLLKTYVEGKLSYDAKSPSDLLNPEFG